MQPYSAAEAAAWGGTSGFGCSQRSFLTVIQLLHTVGRWTPVTIRKRRHAYFEVVFQERRQKLLLQHQAVCWVLVKI
jgi:hypothetical protein